MPVERLRDRIHDTIDRALGPLTRLLGRLGVRPNQITILGTLVCLMSPVLLIAERPLWAGIVWLAGSALDLVDGALARNQSDASRGGAFLDSTFDRVSEGALFAAIAYHFALRGEAVAAAFTVLALLGALLISYTRARAEALGARCTVGIITRAERVLLLGLGLCFGVLESVIYILVALTGVTVAQRVRHTLRELDVRP